MAQPRGKVLRDKDIIDCLDDSEFEDEEQDAFPDNGTDDEYRPNDDREDSPESTSESSSEDEDDLPLGSIRGLGRARGRGIGRGRGSTSRGRSSRGRGSRGRGSRGRGSRGRGSRSSSGHGRGQGDNLQDDEGSSSLPIQQNGVGHEWQEGNLSSMDGFHLSEPSYVPIDCSDFSYDQYFQQYIDDGLIELMVEKSNQMFVYNTGNSLNLTVAECKTYVAITMMMSCINYPYIRMYWERKWRIPLIADAMPRNRFFQLRTSLKLVFDPDVSQAEKTRDKVWKVRPIIERMLQGCQKQVKEQHISIDEMIIPFSGSCGIKQYCPNKPNPVGLKAFVLANPDGTVCDFTIYQGETTYPEENAAGFGLGESAVLNLTRTLVPGHILYFDRYFTSSKLALELINRGYKCAGTIMKNRIPNSLKNDLPDDREMKKQGRGSSVVFVNSSGTAAFTKWFDNKPVLLMSTAYGSEPQDECRRWCKKEKRYIQIQRPVVVKMYNSNMGGVDLADRMLAVCPSRARTNKWTIRFISHMVDLAVSNSWIQYRKTELQKGTPLKKVQSLRQWKMQLAENMIDHNMFEEDHELEENEEIEEEQVGRKRGRPAVKPLPSKIRRLHGQHLPVFVGKTNRCRQPGCRNRTTAMCSTCDVALCLTMNRNCYAAFHQ